MNALADDGNNSTSPNPNLNPNGNKRLYEDDIADQLLHVPTGHHYLILYPDIETMRKVYGSYIKSQLKEPSVQRGNHFFIDVSNLAFVSKDQ